MVWGRKRGLDISMEPTAEGRLTGKKVPEGVPQPRGQSFLTVTPSTPVVCGCHSFQSQVEAWVWGGWGVAAVTASSTEARLMAEPGTGWAGPPDSWQHGMMLCKSFLLLASVSLAYGLNLCESNPFILLRKLYSQSDPYDPRARGARLRDKVYVISKARPHAIPPLFSR